MVAYFCILAGAMERAAVPGKVRRNAPDTTPVSVIGRLAVSRDYAGKGLGADILSDAPRRIAVASQSIGSGAVLVHAKDEAWKRFCLKRAEFIEYPEDSRTQLLPIETVVAAVSEPWRCHGRSQAKETAARTSGVAVNPSGARSAAGEWTVGGLTGEYLGSRIGGHLDRSYRPVKLRS